MGEVVDFEIEKTMSDLRKSVEYTRELFTKYRPMNRQDLDRIEGMIATLNEYLSENVYEFKPK